MTPHQFICELFGNGWEASQLPAFLAMAERMNEDAQRYHVLRDYLSDVTFNEDQRSREQCHEFDDIVDAKRFELLASSEEGLGLPT